MCRLEGMSPWGLKTHVKISPFKGATPDSIHCDVEPSAVLCSVNPCSARGRAVRQVEEHFSLARDMALCRLLGRRSVRSLASFELLSLFSFLMVALDSSCFSIMSWPYSSS